MEQNTDKWHEWRRAGIGASDAPVIMGISPYKTMKQLVEEKRNPETKKEEGNDFIHQKGHKLESKARAKYELMYGLRMATTLAVNKDWNVARASLDGFNEEENAGIEIKYVGKEAFQYMQEKKTIPDTHKHFFAQIQHQYLVTGARVIELVVCTDSTAKLLVIPIPVDLEYIKGMLEKEKEFWKLVQSDEAPAMSKDDVCQVLDKKLQRFMRTFATLAAKEKIAKVKKEAKQLEILEYLKEWPAIDHEKLQFEALKITSTAGKSSTDYDKIWKFIQEQYGIIIDLEDYKKKGSPGRTFKVNLKLLEQKAQAKESKNP